MIYSVLRKSPGLQISVGIIGKHLILERDPDCPCSIQAHNIPSHSLRIKPSLCRIPLKPVELSKLQDLSPFLIKLYFFPDFSKFSCGQVT